MSKPAIQVKNTDAKGRLTLGEGFANRTVLVEQRGEELVVRRARVIPEEEAWLYENPKALSAVRLGLNQARAKKFSKKGPDLRSAAKLALDLADE